MVFFVTRQKPFALSLSLLKLSSLNRTSFDLEGNCQSEAGGEDFIFPFSFNIFLCKKNESIFQIIKKNNEEEGNITWNQIINHRQTVITILYVKKLSFSLTKKYI